LHRLFPIALIFMLALAACSTDTEKRLSTLEDQAQGMAVRDEEIDDRLQALEAEVQEHMASAAGVAVAQFIMDTSGFHGMEESLT
jgi:hypothetical protein